jgi:hypothetical protein
MRAPTAVCCVLAALLQACGAGEEETAGEARKAERLLASPGRASFDPTGNMYVFTHEMDLAIKRRGDDTLYLLTAAPPAQDAAEAGGEESADQGEETSADECVPADRGDPLPGPQGGWNGHPVWSPDGRFIAFMASWVDGNCRSDDDGDWDVWVVDVDGLDLDAWVEVVDTKRRDEQGNPVRKHMITGPDGAGLSYYQVTSTPGPEQRVSWANCRSLAYSTEEAVFLADLSFVPGICEKTRIELMEERERKIAELTENVQSMQEQCRELDEKVATLTEEPEQEEPADR